MGYGDTIDTVVGRLSRLLHLRATETDTTLDFARYLDLPFEDMFPAPRHPPAVRRHRPFGVRSRVTETLSWTSGHRVLCPKYEARHRREYEANATAYVRWMRPRRGRRKTLVLYVHGWLEPGSWVDEVSILPKWYRELDVDIAHVQLPFHGRRRPRGQLFHGEWFWTADLVRSMEAVRQSVFDVRSAMLHFRELGYERIGVAGLSLGGSITMLVACCDPAPDFIVPIIAHLQLAEAVEEAGILWRMKADLERFGVDEKKRREIFARLPLAGAVPRVARENQLWVAAREDQWLKASLVEKQWRAWNEPPILWIDGGHMTFALALDAITNGMKPLVATR